MEKTWGDALEKFIYKNDIEGVERRYLAAALTHPSYGVEHPEHKDYERLEFLGDAVVNLVIARTLFERYPEDHEGDLTVKRSALVQEAALAAAGKTLELERFLRLGKGEEASGGAQRASNISNAYEAVVGAVYLSLGYEKAAELVLKSSQTNMKAMEAGFYGDYKSRLQELVQKTPGSMIIYRMPEEKGPAHDRSFRAELLVDGKLLGNAWGKSKKDAQQEAALQALLALGAIDPLTDDTV